MKKFFYLAIAAVMGLALASCEKPDPNTLTITVTDITYDAATVTVMNSDMSYFYYDIAEPAELGSYANWYEYWANELMISEEFYNENADGFEAYYGITSYDEIKAMYLLQTEDSYDYAGLDYETTYTVFAFKLNEDLTLASATIATQDFTTLEGPSEEELRYELEPTTPMNVTMDAAAAGGYYYNGLMNDNTTFFLLTFQNEAGQACMLNLVAPAGATTIPAGTYNVTEYPSLEDAMASIAAGQILGGNAETFFQTTLGSVYIIDNETGLWITSGSVTVAANGDNYTFTGTLQSHYGSNITLNYTGAVELEDGMAAAGAPAKKMSLRMGKVLAPARIAVK